MLHSDDKFNGLTPTFIIWNLLQRYTKEVDIVVDTMCGRGTTLDAVEELGLWAVGYDIGPHRKDIIQNDTRKIPYKS